MLARMQHLVNYSSGWWHPIPRAAVCTLPVMNRKLQTSHLINSTIELACSTCCNMFHVPLLHLQGCTPRVQWRPRGRLSCPPRTCCRLLWCCLRCRSRAGACQQHREGGSWARSSSTECQAACNVAGHVDLTGEGSTLACSG